MVFNVIGKVSHLNKILAFWLCDEWLELGCREGVNETGLGDDKQEDLGAGEDRKLIGLCDDC